jgi:hypothetical protein
MCKLLDNVLFRVSIEKSIIRLSTAGEKRAFLLGFWKRHRALCNLNPSIIYLILYSIL